ncbi:MAG: GNAT family N-acetyltransferase [Thermoplasmatota archaeon]
MGKIEIRPIEQNDIDWIRIILTGEWGSPVIITRGRSHDGSKIPGLIAEIYGERAGLLTYLIEGKECEIVSLNSLRENIGVGTLLVSSIIEKAENLGCGRLVVTTTNDNRKAVRFYENRGFSIRAIHEGAVTRSRKLKPEIPMKGIDGIEIKDEIEMQLTFS